MIPPVFELPPGFGTTFWKPQYTAKRGWKLSVHLSPRVLPPGIVLRDCLQFTKTAPVGRSGELLATFHQGLQDRRKLRILLKQQLANRQTSR